ncbi:hypothetical protein ALQ74_05291, partial [Pseudomonas savastanoi pv. glycinea]
MLPCYLASGENMSALSKPVRRTVSASQLDDDLVRVLEAMLDSGEKITAHAIVRKIETLGAVSSLTRDTYRSDLIAQYQQLQVVRNQWVERAKKNSQKHLITTLAMKDERIADLERQVALLSEEHER